MIIPKLKIMNSIKIINSTVTELNNWEDVKYKFERAQGKDNLNWIYIFKSSNSKKMYVGRTNDLERAFFNTLFKNYYFGRDEYEEAKFFTREDINRNDSENIEISLINFLNAESEEWGRKKSFDVIYDKNELARFNDNNDFNIDDSYYKKEKVIDEFWKKSLYKDGWVRSKTLGKLRNSALVKYSPLKKTTKQQDKIIKVILKNEKDSFVISGDAGTGKTVLLTHLVQKIIMKDKNAKVAVVVQKNWENQAKKIFKTFGVVGKNLTITVPTKINMDEFKRQNDEEDERYDYIIVDESQTLPRSYSYQNRWILSKFKNRNPKNFDNMLEYIKLNAKQTILFYDSLQSIRPGEITRDQFKENTKEFITISLKNQLRIKGDSNFSGEDYVNGIKYLLYKDTGLLVDGENYDSNFNREVFRQNSKDAYFGYCEDRPLHNLTKWIDEDVLDNPDHIDRIVSGYVEKWQPNTKNETKYEFKEDDLELSWNSTQEDWVNLSEEGAEKQIGSIFAVRGIDLNKVGVLLGNDLGVDSNGKLYARPENIKNRYLKFMKSELESDEYRKELTIFVANIYYVLLTRGIDGVRLGFWNNEPLKKYFKQTLLEG